MFRLNLVLLALAMVCAMSIVTTQFQTRKLYIALEKEKQLSHRLDLEWGRMQLEQATWAAHPRIEKVASGAMGMRLPDTQHKRVVLPEGVFIPAEPKDMP